MSESTTATTATYTVRGMTCGGCARRVRSAIESVQGVLEVDVQLERGLVTVTGEPSPVDVQTAVTDAGYEVVA